MEARDLAERLKECIFVDIDGEPPLAAPGGTRWGYGDADFFVDVEDEGTFLVSVVKVAE